MHSHHPPSYYRSAAWMAKIRGKRSRRHRGKIGKGPIWDSIKNLGKKAAKYAYENPDKIKEYGTKAFDWVKSNRGSGRHRRHKRRHH